MKIAVTCENGFVFQHFGHTPEFAVYDCEGGQIVSSRIVSSGDSGHGSLAGLLSGEQINVLICGGLRVAAEGPGGGPSGMPDAARRAFLPERRIPDGTGDRGRAERVLHADG